MEEELYIEVMTRLMLLDADLPPGATPAERETRADSARSEILAAHGVTAEEVLDFAEAVGTEAGHMEALWLEITQRYDSLRIAELRRTTEARSEAEGKLGQQARARFGSDDAGQAAAPDSAAPSVDGTPRADEPARRAGRQLQRPAKTRPAAADSTTDSS
jgi:hypothetical protein